MADVDIDVIDALAGVVPGSALDAIRARRPEARRHAQASYRALFAPEDPGDVPLAERCALGAFVAGLHEVPAIAAFYDERLARTESALASALAAVVATARAQGPYGRYPAGPLSREDTPGPSFRVDAAARDALGPRLAAAFEHAHMLVLHPRDAAPAALEALLDAGWSTTGIVTLSQLVAFLTFQIRVVVGLRALANPS